jgi:hypothetical protein
VRVEMRNSVPEHVVVRLDGPQHVFEGATHDQEIAPITVRFLIVELGRLGNMPAPPDHDGEAALDVGATEVRVRVLPSVEADSIVGGFGAALLAHRTADPPSELVERWRPFHAPTL